MFSLLLASMSEAIPSRGESHGNEADREKLLANNRMRQTALAVW